MRKIGLFGGSFNPIHRGHIAIGQTMLRAMHLDEVWYMVSPQNPWKQQADLMPEALRLDMTRAALAPYPHLVASDFEFSLPRPSYTWHTLQALRSAYPSCTFTLIIGGDNWQAFDRWAHSSDILATTPIAVFPRQGADISHPLPPGVSLVEVPLVNVTSTMLRRMLADGQDISEYVPEGILPFLRSEE